MNTNNNISSSQNTSSTSSAVPPTPVRRQTQSLRPPRLPSLDGRSVHFPPSPPSAPTPTFPPIPVNTGYGAGSASLAKKVRTTTSSTPFAFPSLFSSSTFASPTFSENTSSSSSSSAAPRPLLVLPNSDVFDGTAKVERDAGRDAVTSNAPPTPVQKKSAKELGPLARASLAIATQKSFDYQCDNTLVTFTKQKHLGSGYYHDVYEIEPHQPVLRRFQDCVLKILKESHLNSWSESKISLYLDSQRKQYEQFKKAGIPVVPVVNFDRDNGAVSNTALFVKKADPVDWDKPEHLQQTVEIFKTCQKYDFDGDIHADNLRVYKDTVRVSDFREVPEDNAMTGKKGKFGVLLPTLLPSYPKHVQKAISSALELSTN